MEIKEDVYPCQNCNQIPEAFISLQCTHDFCISCLAYQLMQMIQDDISPQNQNGIVMIPCYICKEMNVIDEESLAAIENECQLIFNIQQTKNDLQQNNQGEQDSLNQSRVQIQENNINDSQISNNMNKQILNNNFLKTPKNQNNNSQETFLFSNSHKNSIIQEEQTQYNSVFKQYDNSKLFNYSDVSKTIIGQNNISTKQSNLINIQTDQNSKLIKFNQNSFKNQSEKKSQTFQSISNIYDENIKIVNSDIYTNPQKDIKINQDIKGFIQILVVLSDIYSNKEDPNIKILNKDERQVFSFHQFEQKSQDYKTSDIITQNNTEQQASINEDSILKQLQYENVKKLHHDFLKNRLNNNNQDNKQQNQKKSNHLFFKLSPKNQNLKNKSLKSPQNKNFQNIKFLNQQQQNKNEIKSIKQIANINQLNQFSNSFNIYQLKNVYDQISQSKKQIETVCFQLKEKEYFQSKVQNKIDIIIQFLNEKKQNIFLQSEQSYGQKSQELQQFMDEMNQKLQLFDAYSNYKKNNNQQQFNEYLQTLVQDLDKIIQENNFTTFQIQNYKDIFDQGSDFLKRLDLIKLDIEQNFIGIQKQINNNKIKISQSQQNLIKLEDQQSQLKNKNIIQQNFQFNNIIKHNINKFQSNFYSPQMKNFFECSNQKKKFEQDLSDLQCKNKNPQFIDLNHQRKFFQNDHRQTVSRSTDFLFRNQNILPTSNDSSIISQKLSQLEKKQSLNSLFQKNIFQKNLHTNEFNRPIQKTLSLKQDILYGNSNLRNISIQNNFQNDKPRKVFFSQYDRSGFFSHRNNF